MDSILTSIKKLLGMPDEYEHFDQDLIIHINSVFAILNQIGVGPKNGFTISDETATWNQFLPDSPKLESVKSYIYLKAQLMFDPPLSSAVMECKKQQISELEWRLQVAAEELKQEEIQNGE